MLETWAVSLALWVFWRSFSALLENCVGIPDHTSNNCEWGNCRKQKFLHVTTENDFSIATQKSLSCIKACHLSHTRHYKEDDNMENRKVNEGRISRSPFGFRDRISPDRNLSHRHYGWNISERFQLQTCLFIVPVLSMQNPSLPGIIGDIELNKRKQILNIMLLSNRSIRYNPDICSLLTATL